MAVEHVSAVQQLTQQNAPPMSSTGVAQTGILALMMIMMFTMDGRYQSLFGMIGNISGVLKRAFPEICAAVTCAILIVQQCSLNYASSKDDTEEDIQSIWPTFKDPDTILALHAMWYCVILGSIWVCTRQSWPVPASFLHFTAVSLCMQAYLYRQPAFALAGPLAGNFIIVMLVCALVLTLALAWKHKAQTGERIYPLAMFSVLLVSGYVAWSNRLNLATQDVENALFSLLSFVEVGGMLHLAIFCCCSIFSGNLSNSRADGLMLLISLDKFALMYYNLDGFGILPNSTLVSLGAEAFSPQELTGQGYPVLLIVASSIACLALAMLASVAYFLGRFWNEDKVGVRGFAREQRARPAPSATANSVPAGKLSSIIF